MIYTTKHKVLHKTIGLLGFFVLSTTSQAVKATLACKTATCLTYAGGLCVSRALRPNRLTHTTRSLVQPLGWHSKKCSFSSDVSSDQAAYAYNWDTVFAIPVKDVNKAIIDHKSSPKSFTSLVQDADFGDFQVSAGFGDWQLTQGGDGKNVRMSIPLQNLVVQSKKTNSPIRIGQATATAEVKLQFLPHDEAANTFQDQGRPHKLIARDQSTEVTDPVASVININYAEDPDTIIKAIVEPGLSDWLSDHLSEFTHIFAVVNLNEMIDADAQWAFAKPSYVSYAYLDRNDSLDDSLFGVLCMTGGRRGENLSEQISPNTIPSHAEAGFLISQKRFLYDLVRPALKHQWPNLKADELVMSTDGTTLELRQNAKIDLPQVPYNGIYYTPSLQKFSMQSHGKEIEINSYTETEVSPGIWACCTATHWYHITLGHSKNGQTLVYQQSQEPSITHTTRKSEAVEIGEIVAGIATGVGIIVAGILTDGAAFVAVAAVIGLLGGLAVETPNIIQAVNTDNSPAIDLLVLNTTNPIQWTDAKDFTLTSATLNMSLQLGGDPKFV